MGSYYYLLSSLPMLSADAETPLTYGDFLKNCQGNVSEDTYRMLEELTVSSRKGPFLEQWASAYGMLMKELNFQRSQALGKHYAGGTDRDGMHTQAVSAAMAEKNPLRAEQVLLAHEFALLDTLTGLHTFDEPALFGYALKLKLLERRDRFEKEKGRAEFQYLLDALKQQVNSL